MNVAKAAQSGPSPDKRPRPVRARLNAIRARTAPPSIDGPDAAVVTIADEFSRRFSVAAQQWEGQELPDDALDEVMELFEQLIETQATTINGIAAKGRAVLTLAPSDIDMAGRSTTLARKIVEDIVALSDGFRHGAPALQTAPTAATTQNRSTENVPTPARYSATVEHQMLGYIADYDAWGAFRDEAQTAHDAAFRAGDEVAKQFTEIALQNAIRLRHQALRLASLLWPTTPREFGLLARLIADEMAEWWEDGFGGPEAGEFACRGLLDALMNAAGISRSPIDDSSIDDIRRGYLMPNVRSKA